MFKVELVKTASMDFFLFVGKEICRAICRKYYLRESRYQSLIQVRRNLRRLHQLLRLAVGFHYHFLGYVTSSPMGTGPSGRILEFPWHGLGVRNQVIDSIHGQEH